MVAILGVLVVRVIVSVIKFIGFGTVEAANTEALNVHLAITVYIKDDELTYVTAGTMRPNHDLRAGSANTTPKSYLMNPS